MLLTFTFIFIFIFIFTFTFTFTFTFIFTFTQRGEFPVFKASQLQGPWGLEGLKFSDPQVLNCSSKTSVCWGLQSLCALGLTNAGSVPDSTHQGESPMSRVRVHSACACTCAAFSQTPSATISSRKALLGRCSLAFVSIEHTTHYAPRAGARLGLRPICNVNQA